MEVLPVFPTAKKMNFFLVETIICLLLCSIAEARYCNSPACSMCNRLFGPLPGYQLTDNYRSIRHATLTQIDSMPAVAVDMMLAALKLTPKDLLYDLGCGDGRILITAVKKYGCRAVGIEIDPQVAAFAKQKVATSGVGARIRITVGDARKYDLSQATAVTMYLFPDLMRELVPKLSTKRIASYQHKILGIPSKKITAPRGSTIYLAVDSAWW